MDIYSKDIDALAKQQVEDEFKPLPDKDYLDVDKVKENQTHYCVSFIPPQFSRLEQVETLLFSLFLVDKQSITELYNLVNDAKNAVEAVENDPEEQQQDPLHIEKKRINEKFYNTLLKKYTDYKDNNKVYLNNKLVEYYGKDIEKMPLQGALKVRGFFKNSTKALTKAKELSKSDGFTVFIGETGKWMPVNPDKFRLENYETTNKELNELVKGTVAEREKAKKAFGLRTELLKRQGKKIAEDLKNENLENIKKGMFDGPEHFLQRRIETNDVSLTQIDDWSKDPNETREVKDGEIDLLALDEAAKPTSLTRLLDAPTIDI